jgi:2'-hydroxyisoflavone reductase
MNVLVLGGQQFLGKAIVESLLDAGENVSILNRGSRPAKHGARLLTANRYDAAQLQAVLTDSYDCIIDVSGTDPRMIRTTLQSTNVKLCPKYVFISSASVYDRTYSQLPFREDGQGGGDPIWGDYGTMKWQCEEQLRGHYEGILVVLRPPYVYGPNNPDLREQFVWSRALSGLPVPVPGDGLRKLQFCYVRDLAVSVLSLARSTRTVSAVYNVAGDEIFSQQDYVMHTARVAGAEARMCSVFKAGLKARDYFPFRDVDFYLDTSKARQDSVFQSTPIELGLSETLEWFQEHCPQDLRPVLSAVEKDL